METGLAPAVLGRGQDAAARGDRHLPRHPRATPTEPSALDPILPSRRVGGEPPRAHSDDVQTRGGDDVRGRDDGSDVAAAVRVHLRRAEATGHVTDRGRAGELGGSERPVRVNRVGDSAVQGPCRGHDRRGGDGRARDG